MNYDTFWGLFAIMAGSLDRELALGGGCSACRDERVVGGP